jgi:hypothetical protein
MKKLHLLLAVTIATSAWQPAGNYVARISSLPAALLDGHGIVTSKNYHMPYAPTNEPQIK